MLEQISETSVAYRKRVEYIRKREHYEASLVEGLVRETVSLADVMEDLYQTGLNCLIEMSEAGGLVSDAGFDKPFADTVKMFSETACDFLDVAELIIPHDTETGVAIVQQAHRVAKYERDLISMWPWIDRMAIEESSQQYEAGTLMDLETFRNGLRGV
ncbi:MAG: hypothetical protein ABI614_02270 [Planctomycetota bacterium]